MKRILYKNRIVVLILSLLLIISGGIITLINLEIEPGETQGGFLVGLGVGILLIYFAIKNGSN